jgi:hypothetical protein
MHGPCKAGGSGTDILVATILRPLWRTAVTRVAEEQVSRTFYRQVAAEGCQRGFLVGDHSVTGRYR